MSWTISGTQLGRGFGQVVQSRYGLDLQSNVEVNMVAASAAQLESPYIQGRSLPTYAYYKCNSEFYRPLVSGTHSAVDFGFESEVEGMIKTASKGTADTIHMPPLTNIIRTYR